MEDKDASGIPPVGLGSVDTISVRDGDKGAGQFFTSRIALGTRGPRRLGIVEARSGSGGGGGVRGLDDQLSTTTAPSSIAAATITDPGYCRLQPDPTFTFTTG